MDLIFIKEFFIKPDSPDFRIVGNFISKLIDIQGGYKGNKKFFEKGLNMIEKSTSKEMKDFWTRFYNKQDMIEHAYQINQLKIVKQK